MEITHIEATGMQINSISQLCRRYREQGLEEFKRIKATSHRHALTIEKEKQEEAQEKIDAAKARRKESEELTEEILDGVQEASHKATDVNQAQQEIKDMMNKLKLIEDDIKGAAVDKSV